MRYYKGIKRRVRRFFKKPEYPKTVSLDITNPAIKFRIHSAIEAFRTVDYGGERDQVELFIKELHASDVVYDIGASIGLMSLVSAVTCMAGQVVAFEPDPQNFERLEQNIQLNKLQNIIIKPFVLNNKNADISLFTAGSDNVSPSLTGKNVMGLNLGSISVAGYLLDYLIEVDGLPVPDVLKIDVEGAEYNVIQGASKLLSGTFGKRPRFIFLEAHPEFLVDYDVSIDDLLQNIESHGYTISQNFDRDGQQHYFIHLKE